MCVRHGTLNFRPVAQASAFIRLGLCGVSLVAVPAVLAQEDVTHISFELSIDNRRWACSSINSEYTPFLVARIIVSKTGPTPVFGLSRIVFQPVVSGWSFGGDRLRASTDGGSGWGVPDNDGLPANLGRLVPFDASRQGSASASGPLFGHLDSPGSRLRIAGTNAVSLSESTLGWGVQISQAPQYLAGASFNAANPVTVFKFGIDLPTLTGQSSLRVFSVPFESVQPVNGVRGAYWYANPEGTQRVFIPVTPNSLHSYQLNGFLGCTCSCSPPLGPFPDQRRPVGGALRFDPLPVQSCAPCSFGQPYQWFHNGEGVVIGGRITYNGFGGVLRIRELDSNDAGTYRLDTIFVQSNTASVTVYCAADVDDGSGSGSPDGGVTTEDLLYFLDRYAEGAAAADVDDTTGDAYPDGGVTVEDLLFFLSRYAAGC